MSRAWARSVGPIEWLLSRDLKDQALRHFPPGYYSADSAPTVIACLPTTSGAEPTCSASPIQPAGGHRAPLAVLTPVADHKERRLTPHLPARGA